MKRRKTQRESAWEGMIEQYRREARDAARICHELLSGPHRLYRLERRRLRGVALRAVLAARRH